MCAAHVVEFPLLTETWQNHSLEKRFWMARQVYNRTLDEWLKRRRAYFRSPLYQKAHQLTGDKARKNSFWEAKKATGFFTALRSEQIEADVKNELFAGTDPEHHLTAEMIRRVGGRAVAAVQRFHEEKGAGKPKFKSGHKFKYNLNCIEAAGGIRFEREKGVVRIGGPRGGAKPLFLRVDFSKMNSKIERSLEGHGKLSMCSLIRRKINGDVRYFIQLTCKGHAPLAPTVTPKTGVVGVDIGVRCIAAVSDEDAFFGYICDPEPMKESWQKKKALDRVLDHKRRINNPHAFDEKGRWVPGEKISRSTRHESARHLRDEMERIGTEERKRQHYQLINQLLEMGDTFIVEDNPYKGWQASLFGRQVRDFAPATFVQRLTEKAESVGGAVYKVSTWKTYLSSRCHCGIRKKKSLSTRTHKCSECGAEAQRDLYSAFLARHTDVAEEDLNVGRAQEAWSEAEPLLREAFNESKV